MPPWTALTHPQPATEIKHPFVLVIEVLGNGHQFTLRLTSLLSPKSLEIWKVDAGCDFLEPSYRRPFVDLARIPRLISPKRLFCLSSRTQSSLFSADISQDRPITTETGQSRHWGLVTYVRWPSEICGSNHVGCSNTIWATDLCSLSRLTRLKG